MSAEVGSSTEVIYVELLDEGTFVLRPTRGRRVGQADVFEVLATDDYDPDTETWRFTPGSVVACSWESHGGEMLLVAKDLSNSMS